MIDENDDGHGIVNSNSLILKVGNYKQVSNYDIKHKTKEFSTFNEALDITTWTITHGN